MIMLQDLIAQNIKRAMKGLVVLIGAIIVLAGCGEGESEEDKKMRETCVWTLRVIDALIDVELPNEINSITDTVVAVTVGSYNIYEYRATMPSYLKEIGDVFELLDQYAKDYRRTCSRFYPEQSRTLTPRVRQVTQAFQNIRTIAERFLVVP